MFCYKLNIIVLCTIVLFNIYGSEFPISTNIASDIGVASLAVYCKQNNIDASAIIGSQNLSYNDKLLFGQYLQKAGNYHFINDVISHHKPTIPYKEFTQYLSIDKSSITDRLGRIALLQMMECNCVNQHQLNQFLFLQDRYKDDDIDSLKKHCTTLQEVELVDKVIAHNQSFCEEFSNSNKAVLNTLQPTFPVIIESDTITKNTVLNEQAIAAFFIRLWAIFSNVCTQFSNIVTSVSMHVYLSKDNTSLGVNTYHDSASCAKCINNEVCPEKQAKTWIALYAIVQFCQPLIKKLLENSAAKNKVDDQDQKDPRTKANHAHK